MAPRHPLPWLLRRAGLALLLLALGVGQAWAAESNIVHSARATASLITETDAFAPGHRLRIGLMLRMAPGWHTYWVNPGDAGAAPNLDVTLPAGVTAGPISWPLPAREHEGPLVTYGYTGTLLLPLTITPAASFLAPTLPIRVAASWLVCAQICVPEQAEFQIDLPAGAPAPSAQAALFANVDRQMPQPLGGLTAEIGPDGALVVRAAAITLTDWRDAWFLPTDPVLQNAAPQHAHIVPGQLRLRLQLVQGATTAKGLFGILVQQNAAGATTGFAIAARPVALAARTQPRRLLRMLGFAFLGGLILNLMPCVFPILAMKAMALARHAGAARGQVRVLALSYTAGVLVAFASLGMGLVVLRLAADGANSGWGFQFQSPAFVAGMAWVLFVVGLNLSGVFAVGDGWVGAGQGLVQRGGGAGSHLGSFFTGLLAVLVATPCTAPFMGVAIAAALAAPAGITLLVFLALGLGLAAPYLLLAAAPGLAHLLPRPGAWMEILRQALAFPMYGAAVWLVWVVAQEAGAPAVLAVGSGMVLLGFAAWVLGQGQSAARPARRIGNSIAVAALLVVLGILGSIAALPPSDAAPAQTAGTEPFSGARLAALRAEGRPVFVNLTAAWCVTCLVNEKIALAPAAVHQAFAAHHVAYLVGDWTRRNAEISRFLADHGRDGVPLYIFYPAGGGPGVVLPQLLTATMLLHQFAAPPG